MMDSTSYNKIPQSLNHQDPGTMAKKKKEKENRNSISNELLVDFKEKEACIILSIISGPNNDPKKAKVEVSSDYLSITLADNRRFASKLFAEVDTENFEVFQKGSKFIVKFTKLDPTLAWPSIGSAEGVTSSSSHHNNKNHNNNNKNQNNNYNSNSNNSNRSQSNNKMNNVANDTGNNRVCEGEKTDEGCPPNARRITVLDAKTDFTERSEDNMILVYLFIKKVNREKFQLKFNSQAVDIYFSTSDEKFLSSEAGSDQSTLFHYTLPLVATIDTQKCSYRLTNSNIEVKLKKQIPGMWQAVSPVTKAPTKTNVSWEIAAKDYRVKTIPPAPPTPPTPMQARKPTCLVSPSTSNRADRSSMQFSSSVNSISDNPNSGYMGLANIGNTCFMNSVLQTLLNTRELRDYFLSDANYVQSELNRSNPLGQGGRLALAFAVLSKVAWTSNHRSFSPTKLKSVMSLKANQFSGFAQHDAQEFMVELLDGLHEDLNRVKVKPYCAEPPELDGWDDADAAAEAWRLHKQRNDSIIDDLFKGQFRSALTCHECNKVSVKFDEFCCLSVPIPKDRKRLSVLFFYKDILRSPVRVVVSISADAVLEELLGDVGRCVGVAASNITMLEVFKHRIHKVFIRGASMDSVAANDLLYAFEVIRPEQVGGEEVVDVCVTQRLTTPSRPSKCAGCDKVGSPEVRIQRCTKCLNVGYCSTECQKSHWPQHNMHCQMVHEVVGAPFVVSLPKSHATYANLARAMEGYARHSVDIFQPPVAHQQQRQQTARRGGRGGKTASQQGAGSRVRKGSTSSTELSPDEDEPEKMDVENGGSGDRLSGSEDFDKEEGDDDDAFADRPNTVNNDWGTGHQLVEPAPSVNPKRNNSATASSVRAVPPLVPYPKNAATQLFTISPVSSRGKSLPQHKPLPDLGNQQLDLSEHLYLAMDWKTNALNSNDVVCLVKNKEVDYDEHESTRDPDVMTRCSGRQQTTLQACMDLFTQPENLSEGDSWRCPRCKKPVEATKQMSLWKLPPVLIVQLKRFSFKYVLYSDKIDKFVQYPVSGFDVAPHIAAGGGDGQSTQYDLYGVVNHMGRLLGGHYTAYARLLEQNDSRSADIDWRLFDDSCVSNALEDRVVNDQAYLLLYRRRDYSFVLPPVPVQPDEQEQEVRPKLDTNVNDAAASSSVMDTNYFARPNLGEGAVGFSSARNNVDKVVPDTNVVHVPAPPTNASAANVTTVFATSNANVSASFASSRSIYEGNSAGLPPHSNLNNVHVGAEALPTGSTTSSSLQCDNDSNNAYDALFEPLESGDYNATSMINTNNAVCGNFVSNIHIDTVGSSVEAGKEAALDSSSQRLGQPSPFGAVGSSNDDGVSSSTDFTTFAAQAAPPKTSSFFGQSIPLSSSILKSSGPSSINGVTCSSATKPPASSMFNVSSSSVCSSVVMAAPQSAYVCDSSGVYSPSVFAPSDDSAISSNGAEDINMSSDGMSCTLHESYSATPDSTPTDVGGTMLDDATPMSMSSASQPSLSSAEEESISTAQEELD